MGEMLLPGPFVTNISCIVVVTFKMGVADTLELVNLTELSFSEESIFYGISQDILNCAIILA